MDAVAKWRGVGFFEFQVLGRPWRFLAKKCSFLADALEVLGMRSTRCKFLACGLRSLLGFSDVLRVSWRLLGK